MTSELLPPVADVTLILILLCRAALACVFLLAGANKLFDYDTTRRTIADFGLPALLVGPTSLLLPSAEIVVAVLLVSAGLVWWGAVGGSLLLLIFTSAIAVNLALGRTPMCHCFGQLRSRPIGWETVARNVALLLGTMLLLLARPVSREGPVVGMVAHLLRVRRLAVVTGAGALGALVGETSILWMLLRQQGRLLVRLDGVDQRLRSALPGADRAVAAVHGLPVGTRAPSFEVSTAAGPVTLERLRERGRTILLLFSDPGCPACTQLLPAVPEWQRGSSGQLTMVVVSRDKDPALRDMADRGAIECVVFQSNRELAEAYHVPGTPAAILICVDGTICSPVVLGGEAIRNLFQAGAGSEPSAVGLRDVQTAT